MSYIWMEHYLEEQDLKDAFESARTDKKDLLIHFGTSTNDFACVCDEHTDTANIDELESIIKSNKAYHDNCHIIKIYDTSKDFNTAAMTDGKYTAAIQNVLDKIKRQEDYEYAMWDRPWWRKLFNMQPKNF